MAEETTSPTFRMWLRPDGIVQLVWEPGVPIGVEDCVAAGDTMDALAGGQKHPLMADTRAGGPSDRASAHELIRRDEFVSAIAVIVNTPLRRMLGNLFIARSRPTLPLRLFVDEASALAWLAEFAP